MIGGAQCLLGAFFILTSQPSTTMIKKDKNTTTKLLHVEHDIRYHEYVKRMLNHKCSKKGEVRHLFWNVSK